MTEIHQENQFILGTQQNADHITNTYSKAPWKPPLMLPPRAQSFVGRDEDLAWLLQQLRQDPVAGGRTIAICGPGGMGKTALVAEVLVQLRAYEDFSIRFPDGIFYHSFYAYPTPAVAYEELACIFEEEIGTDPYRAAVRALSRQALLIFDGLEVLPADHVPPLRHLGGQNSVLLLSRRHTDASQVPVKRTLTLISQV